MAFLIDGPRKVIALDLNACQNHLLDLKMAAFRRLEYGQLLEFLGASPSRRRRALYQALRGDLAPDSRHYWDSRPNTIAAGVIHCGRYEGYMRFLRVCLNSLMGHSMGRKLFAVESDAERIALYRREWDNLRWRLLTRVLLSRAAMTLFFDKAFFAQLEESFSLGNHFRERVRRAMVELPLHQNSFLSYILLGRFPSQYHLPVYLQEENFDAIRSRLDRIEMVCGSCEDYLGSLPSDSIAKFSFTNVFEWMSRETFERVLRETVRVAVHGAVLTYRNLLVPRSRPESLARWIKPERELSEHLYRKDLSFVYRAYVVERISKG